MGGSKSKLAALEEVEVSVGEAPFQLFRAKLEANTELSLYALKGSSRPIHKLRFATATDVDGQIALYSGGILVAKIKIKDLEKQKHWLALADSTPQASNSSAQPPEPSPPPSKQIPALAPNRQQAGKRNLPTAPWSTVRIFISSTFRDFHFERDQLVRLVFPELRARLAKRKLCPLHCVEIDLRWGVTEEEAESGAALSICLNEVDRCRPFFLGMLSERYGWRPPQYDLPARPEFDYIRSLPFGFSVTHLEFLHGVLHEEPPAGIPALVFLRDSSFATAPAVLSASHLFSDYLSESTEAASALKELKAELKKSPNAKCFDYSVTPHVQDGRVVLRDLEFFSATVSGALWSLIEAAIPDVAQLSLSSSALGPAEAAESQAHRNFIELRSRSFFGRQSLLKQLHEHVEAAAGKTSVPAVLVGSAGAGKSALMTKFASELMQNDAVHLIPHFVGVTPSASSLSKMVERVVRVCAYQVGITDPTAGQDLPFETLRDEVLPSLLQTVSAKTTKTVVILIDAVNELVDRGTGHARRMEWLPSTLPSNVAVVLSLTSESVQLNVLRSRDPVVCEIGVNILPRVPDATLIVRATMAEYGKTLDERPQNNQLEMLLSHPEATRPLYLIIAMEEIRVFGFYEQLSAFISSLPATLPALLDTVLERLEDDHGKELVSVCMSLIATSRHGIQEHDLIKIITARGHSLPAWLRLSRSLSAVLLRSSESLKSFVFREVVTAVNLRYLSQSSEQMAIHSALAELYLENADPTHDMTWATTDPYYMTHLPYHASLTSNVKLIEPLLTLSFVSTRVSLGHAYDVVGDFDFLLSVIETTTQPDLASLIPVTREFCSFLHQNADNLARYPALTIQQALNSDGESLVHKLASSLSLSLLPAGLMKLVNIHKSRNPCVTSLPAPSFLNSCVLVGSSGVAALGDKSISVWSQTTGRELLSCTTSYIVASVVDLCSNRIFAFLRLKGSPGFAEFSVFALDIATGAVVMRTTERRVRTSAVSPQSSQTNLLSPRSAQADGAGVASPNPSPNPSPALSSQPTLNFGVASLPLTRTVHTEDTDSDPEIVRCLVWRSANAGLLITLGSFVGDRSNAIGSLLAYNSASGAEVVLPPPLQAARVSSFCVSNDQLTFAVARVEEEKTTEKKKKLLFLNIVELFTWKESGAGVSVQCIWAATTSLDHLLPPFVSVHLSPSCAFVAASTTRGEILFGNCKADSDAAKRFSEPVRPRAGNAFVVIFQEETGRVLAFSRRDNNVYVLQIVTAPDFSVSVSSTLLGHTRGVTAAAWNPIKECFATGSMDKRVILWSATPPHSIIAAVSEHSGQVNDLSVADSGLVFSCGRDRMVRVTDVDLARRSPPRDGHDDGVMGLSFAPHNSGFSGSFVSASLDGTLALWTSTKSMLTLCGRTQASSSRINAVDFSNQFPGLVVSAGADKLVRLWSVRKTENGSSVPLQLTATNINGEKHSNWIHSVKFAPSSGLAVDSDSSPTSTLASCARDSRVLLWSVECGSSASGDDTIWQPKALKVVHDFSVENEELNSLAWISSKHLLSAGCAPP
eukprot:TRINITY_DN1225_c0_g1_i4.p1 TRINITY_DN1225_c0_g1~~TRINITY_DN1225_c0_g1_i4.p1  ORF type:complete len:1549 (-),score=321.95 TRINITY_DN1225_c0_g1_i4:386-5032(-)